MARARIVASVAEVSAVNGVLRAVEGATVQIYERATVTPVSAWDAPTAGNALTPPYTTNADGLIIHEDADEIWVSPQSLDIVATKIGMPTQEIPYEAYSARPLDVNESPINVQDPEYGATGDGVTDDTDALDAAAAAVTQVGGSAVLQMPTIFFPSGRYVYNGSAFFELGDRQGLKIVGEGRSATEIVLDTDAYLITGTNYSWHLDLSDLTVSGGGGAIRFTRTISNVGGQCIVERCAFLDYTVCAISHNSSDFPEWKIRDCVFDGDTEATIGVALPGLTDDCEVVSNVFFKNRVHVKLGEGGNSARVQRNSFLRYDTANTYPRIDVWIVPSATSDNAGTGLSISDNKFGNENREAGDRRIVYADQAAGTHFADRMPVLGSDSTGYIIGHKVTGNLFGGNSTEGAASLIYSTTPNLYQNIWGPNQAAGTPPTQILELRTAPTDATGDPHFHSTNQLGPLFQKDLNTTTPILATNGVQMGRVVDHLGNLSHHDAAYHHEVGGGASTDFVNVPLPRVTAFSNSNSSETGIDDAAGGPEAAEVTVSSANGYLYGDSTGSLVRAGKPAWVEFDLKDGASSPVSTVLAQVATTGNVILESRLIDVPANWSRFRFRFTPRTTGEVRVRVGSATTGQFKLGRVRFYHAREPVAVTPPAGASETVASATTITVADTTQLAKITGTTSITSVTRSYDGHRLVLKFADALTFTDGSNLKLNGNFVTSADDTITLVCDGTNWYEMGRSAN